MKRAMWVVLGVATVGWGQSGGFGGPYGVVMEKVAGLPEHTVYRPAEMGQVRGKAPVVAYGNGGCANSGNLQAMLLGEVASWGFVVTAPGPVWRKGVVEELPAGGVVVDEKTVTGGPPAQAGPEVRRQSKPDQMMAVLDWVKEENHRKGSVYKGRLDEGRIGVMGWSCGGLEAIFAAGDARVKTLIAMNSGIIRGPRPANSPMRTMPATEAELAKVHTPTLYLIGGPADIAYKNAEKDFEMLEGVPLFHANLAVGHGGTWGAPRGGSMGAEIVNWLKWQLKGDKAAGKRFAGEDCGLCGDPKWTVKKKGMK